MIALLLFALLGNVEAATKLAEIRARFSTRDKAQSLRELEKLAREARTTEAGGQAAAWLGALEQQSGDLEGAAVWFDYAESAPAGGEARLLAARGMGNLALAHHRYGEARRKFAEAATGASGAMAEELAQKQALSVRLLARQRVEWAAWSWLGAVFVYFLARTWRGQGPFAAPLEVIYVMPIYALLIAGGMRRDPLVLRALVLTAAGSLLLILTAGLATRRSPPNTGQRWLSATLLVAANLALFYAVLNRMGLIETLIVTAQM